MSKEPKRSYPTDRKPTGPRPTAGRPAKVADPVRVTLTIEACQLEWLNRQGDKSQTIRDLINQAKAQD